MSPGTRRKPPSGAEPHDPHGPVLLRTKLHRPRPPLDAVDRPRQLTQLDDVLEHRLTLVSAGPGFGKTTLAAQWLDRREIPSSWLSLDSLDSDPDRFARHFVAALEAVLPEPLPNTDALLRARTLPPWSHFCDVLLSELAPPASSSVVVLEDYHALASEDVDRLLIRLIGLLPGPLHLLVLTRTVPAWPLGLWRGRDWVTELRSEDLLFSKDETRVFLERRRCAVDEETLGILQQKTEGWIGGLHLAALSMAAADRPVESARTLAGSNRNIADFLVQEVLDRQPHEVREFLAATALLDRFTASLCDHILSGTGGTPDSQAALARLEAQNLFLVPLDEEREWYRYHHLFRDVLPQVLNQLGSSEFRVRVHTRAGEWFAREGLVEDALRHWVEAGDIDSAAALIGERVDIDVAADPSRRVLARWLQVLPAGAERGRAALLLAHAYQKILLWDFQGLEELLGEAERVASSDRQPFRSNFDALWAMLRYWQGRPEETYEYGRRALESGLTAGGMAWTLANIYTAGGLLLLGRHVESRRVLDKALDEARRHQFAPIDLLATRPILRLYWQDFDVVRKRSLELLALHERQPLSEYWLGYVYYLLGVEAYERNRLAEARKWFGNVAALRYLVMSRLYQDALVGLALVAWAEGDVSKVEALGRDIRSWAIEIGAPALVSAANSIELRLAVAAGTPPAMAFEPPPAVDHQSFWLELPTATWAERLIADPSAEVRDRALPFVEAAMERMRRNHNLRQATVLSALRAVALDVSGRRDEALDSLAATLRNAEPRGLVRAFIDRGPRLKALLDALAERDGPDTYRDRLRDAFLEEGTVRHAVIGLEGEKDVLLSYRELEVLELLAERLTNQQIADRLGVTPGAIKKRTRSLYHKLGARDRHEAVKIALSRGVVSSRP